MFFQTGLGLKSLSGFQILGRGAKGSVVTVEDGHRWENDRCVSFGTFGLDKETFPFLDDEATAKSIQALTQAWCDPLAVVKRKYRNGDMGEARENRVISSLYATYGKWSKVMSWA
jgi:hypothetical protein